MFHGWGPLTSARRKLNRATSQFSWGVRSRRNALPKNGHSQSYRAGSFHVPGPSGRGPESSLMQVVTDVKLFFFLSPTSSGTVEINLWNFRSKRFDNETDRFHSRLKIVLLFPFTFKTNKTEHKMSERIHFDASEIPLSAPFPAFS